MDPTILTATGPDREATFVIGKSLNHYRILESLGKGGMGEVWLAEDTRLDRRVALKILPPEVASDPERLARFTREAKAIAALNHPNIVTIHAVETSGDLRFLAMELVDGRTLDHLILKDGLPVSKILDVGVPLADALATAHERGITHRDLKPGNVMVTDRGRVKMLDFGLARHAERPVAAADTQLPTEHVTRDGVIMGTLPYMSPEQAEGKPVDHRSDIFSLGVILHEMATGARPFQGDTAPGLLSAILKDTPPSVTEVRPELPADLARVIGRCLMKDPLERFQTARDVFNELRMLQRQIDSGSSVLTGSSPAVGAALPQRAPSTLPWILGVAAVVLAAAAGIWWLMAGREAATATPGPPAPGPAAPAAADRKMMVVLPFENLGEAEDDFFAAGIAEEIMSRLASLDGLGVISRKSAMTYAGTDKTIRQIGEELGVDYVLEGTIRWARAEAGTSRVRITPQLIQVSDDTQIWSETYDRVLEDIFDVQAEIATRVAEQMGVSLLEPQKAALTERPTESIHAWQDYVRGKEYAQRYDFQWLSLAVDMLQRAVEKDPGFVQAWSVLARAHASIMHFGYDTSEQRDRRALEAARKALELDPRSADAHLAMGYYHYHGHKDYEAALREFEAAGDLRADDPEILEASALVLRRQGRWRESTRSLEKAVQVDPRNSGALINLGDNLIELDRYEEALEVLDRADLVSPDVPWVSYYRILAIWLQSGDLEATRAILERVPPGDQIVLDWFWTWQLITEGDYDGALEYLDGTSTQWVPLGPAETSMAFLRAWIHELKGEEDEARRLYDEARRELEPLVAAGDDRSRRLHGMLGLVYAGLGLKEEALRQGRLAMEALPLSRDAVWGDEGLSELAWIQVKTGELDAAFDTLERLAAIPQSQISPALLEVNPAWAPLKSHPRYTDLLGKLSSPPVP